MREKLNFRGCCLKISLKFYSIAEKPKEAKRGLAIWQQQIHFFSYALKCFSFIRFLSLTFLFGVFNPSFFQQVLLQVVAFSWLRLEREKHCFGRCESEKKTRRLKKKEKIISCVFLTSLVRDSLTLTTISLSLSPPDSLLPVGPTPHLDDQVGPTPSPLSLSLSHTSLQLPRFDY